MIFHSLALTSFLLTFQYFTLFQMTMSKGHKIYHNCIWHVVPEFLLFFQSSQSLQFSEIQLFKNQCEQEQTEYYYSDAVS